MAVNLSLIGGAGWQFLDDNGDPLSGGKIYTYAAGTTTPLTTYTSRTGTIPNTNPIILDAAGRTPQQIWATEGLLYKYVVKTSADVLIRTWDNIGGSEVASDLAQDLANTTDNTKGDALVGFRQSNAAGFLTGSVGRTVNNKLQEFVSVLDFGADPTGVVDSSAAIQAAINAIKPLGEVHPEKGGFVHFPAGTYLVNTTINTYSGVNLIGDGIGTIIRSGPSLTSAVFYLTQATSAGYHTFGSIRSMKIQTVPDIFTPVTNTIWAIRMDPAVIVGSCVFENIVLWVRYGIKLDGYVQNNLIHTVTSVAQVDQILNLRGNYNRIVSLCKEAGGGEGPAGSGVATTEPYVFVGGEALPYAPTFGHNIFEHLLIEGAGSPSKSAVKFKNAIQTQIKDVYVEVSQTNGYRMELDASNVSIGSTFTVGFAANTFDTGTKIRLINGSYMYIEEFDASAGIEDWQLFFDYDNRSFVEIEIVKTELSHDIYKIASSNNLIVKKYVDNRLVKNSAPGRTPLYNPHYRSGQNLLLNPSFEAGEYAWAANSASPVTVTFPASQVAQGNMIQCVMATTSTNAMTLEQSFTVTADQVGTPLTFTCVLKYEGIGFAYPVIAGYAAASENRIYPGTGWQTLTITYRPQTAGTFSVGISTANTGGVACVLTVDEASLCFGDEGVVNTSKFGSFELSQRTFIALTAAPTTGTWKRGDRVFNSTPSTGQPKGWICTVAGTPGTWVSEGNL